MAEIAGGAHNEECENADGHLCVCSCRGAFHGVRHHHNRGARLGRMTDVTVSAKTGPGADRDNGGGGMSAAERRKHPVNVTALHATDDPPPVKPDPQPAREWLNLNALDDEGLAAAFTAASERGDETQMQAIWDEMGWREQQVPAPDNFPEGTEAWLTGGSGDNWPDQWVEERTPQDEHLDRLLAAGWDYLDAYAEVHQLDATKLARQQAAGSIERRTGETLDRAVRRQYDEWVHLQYVAAEHETRGNLLTREAVAAGIQPVELFSGPTARARRYASEDLQRWWADNGRMTLTEFRAQILGRDADRRAAEATRLQGNGRDFI